MSSLYSHQSSSSSTTSPQDQTSLQNLRSYLGQLAPLSQQSLPVISSEISGQLPSDVQAQLNQQAAERGVSTGTTGSPNAGAAYLRALGLNSLQMQQLGQQNLSQAYNNARGMLTGYGLDRNASSSGSGYGYGIPSYSRGTGGGGGGGGGGGMTRMPGIADTGSAWMPSSGGGGGSVTTTSIPTAASLFGYGDQSSGMPMGDLYGQVGYATDPYVAGYQPTSAGTMYMGDPSGYSGVQDALGYLPSETGAEFYSGEYPLLSPAEALGE